MLAVCAVPLTTHAPSLDATELCLRLGPLACLDAAHLGPYAARAAAVARGETPSVPRAAPGGAVALIDVEGPLARYAWAYRDFVILDGYDRLAAQVRGAIDAYQRGEVERALLRVDSPGGTTAGLFEGLRQLRAELDEAGLEVDGWADELAASAGAAILVALSDRVHLPPEGRIGSIGTIATHYDISRALANAGITVTHIVDPEGKAAGWPEKPLDDDARERWQEHVSDISRTFFDLVAGRRGKTAEEIRAFDARMFTGAKAVAAGLADEVTSWPALVSRAEEMAQKNKEKRRMKGAVYALLGLPDNASAEDVEKAATAAKAVFDLGKKTLEITAAPGAEEAKGTLAAWKLGAAEANQLRVDAAEQQKQRDAQERDALYTQIAQREPPGSVWNGGDKGKGAQPWLAEMSLSALRSYVASRPQTPALRATEEEKQSAAEPTDAEVEAFAKQYGVSKFIARAEVARQKGLN